MRLRSLRAFLLTYLLLLVVAGRHRSVLLRDILRGGAVQGRRSWFCLTQRLISSQRLEHDGLRRRRYRVSAVGWTNFRSHLNADRSVFFNY